MKHKIKVTVIDKKLYPELQEKYCAGPKGLQGGSIMKGWMKEENTMITCCSDGTRPVIFKIERIDY